MALMKIPTRTDDSLGRQKYDQRPAEDLEREIQASEYNATADAVIELAQAVGLADGSTAGSLTHRVNGLESRSALDRARLGEVERALFVQGRMRAGELPIGAVVKHGDLGVEEPSDPSDVPFGVVVAHTDQMPSFAVVQVAGIVPTVLGLFSSPGLVFWSLSQGWHQEDEVQAGSHLMGFWTGRELVLSPGRCCGADGEVEDTEARARLDIVEPKVLALEAINAGPRLHVVEAMASGNVDRIDALDRVVLGVYKPKPNGDAELVEGGTNSIGDVRLPFELERGDNYGLGNDVWMLNLQVAAGVVVTPEGDEPVLPSIRRSEVAGYEDGRELKFAKLSGGFIEGMPPPFTILVML